MIKTFILSVSLILSTSLFSQVNISPVLGPQTLAIVPFDYALDSNHIPLNEIDSAFFTAPNSMKAFYEAVSYGKMTFDGTVYPYRRNQPPLFGVGYTNCYPTDAIIANQADVDYSIIDGIILLPHDTASKSCAAGNSSFSKLPFTTPNGPMQFRRSGFRTDLYFPRDFSGTVSSTIAHELLHSLGNGFHSNSYVKDSGVWKVQGYGNVFDILGLRSQASHPCSMIKHKLGWLTSNEVLNVSQADTFRIYPLEQTLPGQTQCLIIDLNDQLDIQPTDTFKFDQLYLEYRGLTGFDSRSTAQRRVRLKDNSYYPNNNLHGLSIVGVDCKSNTECLPILIDMHPDPIGGIGAAYFPHEASDAPLRLNESYQVATSDSISIKVVNVSPGNYIDVAITMPSSVSLEDYQKSQSKFELYPAPVKDFLNIEGQGGRPHDIQIFDGNGQLIMTKLRGDKLDLRSLKAGLYIVVITDMKTNVRTQKRIIKI